MRIDVERRAPMPAPFRPVTFSITCESLAELQEFKRGLDKCGATDPVYDLFRVVKQALETK